MSGHTAFRTCRRTPSPVFKAKDSKVSAHSRHFEGFGEGAKVHRREPGSPPKGLLASWLSLLSHGHPLASVLGIMSTLNGDGKGWDSERIDSACRRFQRSGPSYKKPRSQLPSWKSLGGVTIAFVGSRLSSLFFSAEFFEPDLWATATCYTHLQVASANPLQMFGVSFLDERNQSPHVGRWRRVFSQVWMARLMK